MTQEEIQKEEIQRMKESSRAFKAAAKPFVEMMARSLNLGGAIREDTCVSHQVETEPVDIHGVSVAVKMCRYGNMRGGMSDNICVEVSLDLPDSGVTADQYLVHVAEKVGFTKNIGGKYAAGPRYRNYADELRGRQVEAYSPWNNQYLVVNAGKYTVDRMEEAVRDVLVLAKPLVEHLSDLSGLRFWTADDAEVKEKAREIIRNADLHETDVDRETKSHWLEDRNSFFKGWFDPWNDRGRGTFDTIWPSSLDHAARGMGLRGSFEYAVACILLVDEEFIAKARKACVIRRETVTQRY